MDENTMDPAHPLRSWIPEPIPRRAPTPVAELERLALAADALAAELRALAHRMTSPG